MSSDDFTILTEFAVALAGFSGVALAITHPGGPLTGLQRFRTVCLLAWSLAPAFGGTLPLLAEAWGAEGPQVWQWSSAGFAVVALGLIGVPIYVREGVAPKDRPQLARALWVLSIGGGMVLSTLLAVNAWRLASPGPLVFAILYHILLAAILFARLLLAPISAARATKSPEA